MRICYVNVSMESNCILVNMSSKLNLTELSLNPCIGYLSDVDVKDKKR